MTVENRASSDKRSKVASFLALFTSTDTLLCCALPVAISAIAGGATEVGLINAVP